MGVLMHYRYYSLLLIITILFSGFVNIFHFENINMQVEAKSIYVDCNGYGNHTTIQAAINAANLGDTIYVWNGTYNEDIIVNKRVTIIGNGTVNTTINGTGNGNVILVTVDYVNISGFKVIGSGSDQLDAGIQLNGVAFCSIVNNNISNNNAIGIFINQSFLNTIANNTCISNVGSGIRIGAWPTFSDYNKVTNNTCNSNNFYGIYLFYANSNIIENNTCNSNMYNGIWLGHSDFNTIRRNICTPYKYFGIYLAVGQNYFLPIHSILCHREVQ